MELENQLLEELSLKDLLDLSRIQSSGTDFGTGKRDVNLADPLEYNTYSAEDVPLPEGTEVIVEGSPLNQQEILKQKRKADIENDQATPTLKDFYESLPYRQAVDDYEIKKQRDQLAYIFENYPKYQREAYAALMPLIAQSRRISEGMPSSIQARMYASALTAKENASRQAQMLNAATNAATAGLGRYPGIRVT